MCMMLVMLPFFMLAMYEKHGQPLEKIVGNILKVAVIRPKQRPYQTNNFYAVLKRQMCIRDSRRTGGQPSLDLDLIESQRQTAHQPFFLLEVQSGQLAVILLGNGACLKAVAGFAEPQ